jgi:hypothetical protein
MGGASQQKPAPVQQADAKRKDASNINFKGRPNFTKSSHVGNKGDFPELGDEHVPRANAILPAK